MKKLFDFLASTDAIQGFEHKKYYLIINRTLVKQAFSLVGKNEKITIHESSINLSAAADFSPSIVLCIM